MEIDKDLIERRLAEIKGAINELRDIGDLGLEEFLTNSHIRYAAKYLLIMAIGGAFSICNHIVVRKGDIPSSYSDCFLKLSRLGIISGDLAERLAQMAKFRNMLVHVYWRIDDEKVFEILREDIVDLEEFIRAVVRYLEKV
ncbi:type VII toxin-antitoxin system HepT family RNase toxin [Pyrococcus abyssi]|uniref:DUF86 domain-containing protein n=1 Tax=Pyrococcus abyssi (strain GE5 / Orsay) TaxID=272844 RepID=Q9V2Q4_PYRAB|nr:DUF86 domain-containing protein [Pyrococcus abyssi]CAB48944.1 Hypothetical protein PAB2339 [Pyrococcus abyssi GE5]CCE69389.1 TPA: hypothetical protein PAB2339 [Pyrococcus abyssi GE5]